MSVIFLSQILAPISQSKWTGLFAVAAVCLAFVFYMIRWDNKNSKRENLQIPEETPEQPASNDLTTENVKEGSETVEVEKAPAEVPEEPQAESVPDEEHRNFEDNSLERQLRLHVVEMISDEKHHWKESDTDIVLGCLLSSNELATSCDGDTLNDRKRYIKVLCDIMAKDYGKYKAIKYNKVNIEKAREELLTFMLNLEWFRNDMSNAARQMADFHANKS